MKPLILILLTSVAAVTVQAQSGSLADIARRERARRAQAKTTMSFKTQDIRSKTAVDDQEEAAEAAAGASATPAPEAVAAAVAAATPAPVAAAPDPAQQWNEETTKIRTRVRELMDQETTNQLQINNLTNQLFAPQSSQTARDQAQSDLQTAQQKLQGIRIELTRNRGELQAREIQGPPKK